MLFTSLDTTLQSKSQKKKNSIQAMTTSSTPRHRRRHRRRHHHHKCLRFRRHHQCQAESCQTAPKDEHHQHPPPHHHSEIIILMVPLPAQGHLNQLLQLSLLISTAYPRIPIHFASSSTHNSQACLRSSVAATNICFHDLSAPPFPSPPPNPNSPHKFPSHLIPTFCHANVHLRDPISELICSLSSSTRRLIVINDSLMASCIQQTFSLPNAESYTFHSVSAFTIHWFLNESTKDKGEELLRCFIPEFLEFIRSHHEFKKHSSGSIFNTCRVVEGTYMDELERQSLCKHWALGPFNTVNIDSLFRACHCLEWLDMQEPRSVLYVSFGTTTAFTDEQVRELSLGLEKSGHKFIWVLREADRGDVFEGEVRKMELPEGFEERVKRSGIGLVVKEWAPQLQILGHRSTGGFMSHCGWNSCMESISMGVPVAAWPIHSDQPKNAELLTRVLGVGILVQRSTEELQDGVVRAETIERAVRKLMGSGGGGEEVRRKAEALGIKVRKSAEDGGGASRAELDSFIAHISRH